MRKKRVKKVKPIVYAGLVAVTVVIVVAASLVMAYSRSLTVVSPAAKSASTSSLVIPAGDTFDAEWQAMQDASVNSDKANALHHAELAVALSGTDAQKSQALYWQGTYQNQLGLYDKAEASFRQSISLSASVSAEQEAGLGLTLMHQGKLDDATVAFNKALAINAEFGPAYNSRALVEQQQGKHAQALADINKALSIDPTYQIYINNKQAIENGDGQHSQ